MNPNGPRTLHLFRVLGLGRPGAGSLRACLPLRDLIKSEGEAMRARRSVPENQTGVALVEMALAAPILVMVLFGLLEFGYLLYAKGVIANASREAARLGVVLSHPRKTQAEIEDQVRSYLEKSGFDAAAVRVTYPNGLPGSSGSPFAVRLQYAYNFKVLPNFIQSLTGSLGLSAETVMLME